MCFISASAKEISKSISLKSAIFYGRLNRSSSPGELLSRLAATFSIIMCPQPGGQHPRILTCKLYPSVNIRKIVCPVGEITNRLSGVCLFDIWLTELSNFCSQLQHRNQEMCFLSSLPLFCCFNVHECWRESKWKSNPSLHDLGYSQ